jgi:hypothetical protein
MLYVLCHCYIICFLEIGRQETMGLTFLTKIELPVR